MTTPQFKYSALFRDGFEEIRVTRAHYSYGWSVYDHTGKRIASGMNSVYSDADRTAVRAWSKLPPSGGSWEIVMLVVMQMPDAEPWRIVRIYPSGGESKYLRKRGTTSTYKFATKELAEEMCLMFMQEEAGWIMAGLRKSIPSGTRYEVRRIVE